MLTKRTERCAVARREPDGGHAAQHLSNIEMASRRLCPTASESTAAVVVPSPRSCGERAAQIFQQGLMGEGLLRSKSTRQEPLTRHSLPKVRAALSPQERGEGTNTGTAFFDAVGLICPTHFISEDLAEDLRSASP